MPHVLLPVWQSVKGAEVAIDAEAATVHFLRMGPRTATLEGDMTPDAIGARLTLIREAFGLSKAEIADMLEIDRTHWSRFEGGQRAIPYDKASRLVARFGVTLDFIILGKWGGLEFGTAERLRRASA
jgi:antitoxin component HigA of HigAB toxin-antitoxin module